MKTTAALLAGISLLSLVAGCTADAADDSASANQDLVAPMPIKAGSFDMFTQPHYAPESSCERLTKLDVKDLNAHLEEAFVGPCATFVAVDPNKRDYKLTRTGTSCGSGVYAASFTKGGETWSLKLTDHRSRVCRDIVPALIVIEETHGSITTKLYSQDVKPQTDAVLEGELASVMGIGGESTGVAIMTDEGMFELLLDASERARFVDGKRARLKGKKTTLSGVETHDRPAFDVSDMLVCPNAGWVNCMPGGPVPAACSEREWIRANCEGVDFAD